LPANTRTCSEPPRWRMLPRPRSELVMGSRYGKIRGQRMDK
jgi:hypothetical protein